MELMNYLQDIATEVRGIKICFAPRRKLAKIFGVSPCKIWRGLKQLQEKGSITQYYHNGKASIWEIK